MLAQACEAAIRTRRIGLVQPCRAGLAVDPEPRAQRKGGMNFSKRTNYSARQRRAKLDSICGVISTDALVVHHNASGARLTAKDKKAVCVWAAMEIEREK